MLLYSDTDNTCIVVIERRRLEVDAVLQRQAAIEQKFFFNDNAGEQSKCQKLGMI